MKLPGQGALVGRRLGRYQLDALLGAGGMAEVYRAHALTRLTNRPTSKLVAVKVLPEHLAQDEGYVRRFREEYKRVRKVESPNIVPVWDAGEDQGLLYLVMPLYKESLRDRMTRYGKPPIPVAVHIARQIASALDAAHKRRVLHRDVKPENILLDNKGDAFLTDFGIARDLVPAQGERGATRYTLSASGLPVGTPEYMPPEQLLGRHLDERADIYALGVVLYELLTGKVPFEAENPYQVAAMVVEERLRPPSELNPAIPRALDEAVVWALQRNPVDRYTSIAEFDQALKQAMKLSFTQHLTMGAPRNFRLTERLADESSLALAGGSAAPPLLSGLPHFGPQGATGYGASGMPPGYVPDRKTLAAIAEEMKTAGFLPTRTPRVQVAILAGALAILLLTVCGGGSLFAANRLGLTFTNGDPSIGGSKPTATIALAPIATATAIPTTVPTNTVVIRPTATRILPTPTATPVPLLSVSPLQLTKTSSHSLTCRGTQYITNSSGESISWQWQSSSPALPSSFLWGFSSPPQNGGWPSGSTGPGQSITLYAQQTCIGGSGQSYEVKMTDSLGRTYTFTMQSQ